MAFPEKISQGQLGMNVKNWLVVLIKKKNTTLCPNFLFYFSLPKLPKLGGYTILCIFVNSRILYISRAKKSPAFLSLLSLTNRQLFSNSKKGVCAM